MLTRYLKLTKRITVTFDDGQYEAVRLVKGMGERDADRVRSIVVAYLSEHSYIKDTAEPRAQQGSREQKRITGTRRKTAHRGEEWNS